MNLEQIMTFLQVYQLGSFQEAADHMYLPQPTISHRINKLEKFLGKTLLIRSRGKVRLTEEGKAFLPYARHIQSALIEGKEAIEDVGNGELGKLSIGSYNSFSNCVLPDILDDFTIKYPKVSINIHSLTTNSLINLIKQSIVHCAITRFRKNDNNMMYQRLFTEPIYAIVSTEHHLAKRSSVPLDELLREPLITYQKNSQNRDMLDFTMSQCNLNYHAKIESNNLVLIKHFIKQNLGIHISGTIYMRKEIQKKELVPIEIESNPFPISSIYVARMKGSMNKVEKMFVDCLSDRVNQPL